jgi:hypothetical protein
MEGALRVAEMHTYSPTPDWETLISGHMTFLSSSVNILSPPTNCKTVPSGQTLGPELDISQSRTGLHGRAILDSNVLDKDTVQSLLGNTAKVEKGALEDDTSYLHVFRSTSLLVVNPAAGVTYGGKVSKAGEAAIREGLQTEMVGHFWSTGEAHFFSTGAD